MSLVWTPSIRVYESLSQIDASHSAVWRKTNMSEEKKIEEMKVTESSHPDDHEEHEHHHHDHDDHEHEEHDPHHHNDDDDDHNDHDHDECGCGCGDYDEKIKMLIAGISIEEEIEILKEAKEELEEHLNIVNTRLQKLTA